jgi:predicted RNA-binding Zn-ribbon protein involved in translation (DUF1610 family)
MTDADLHCMNCGHAAPADSPDWTRARHPSLGAVTQCSNCGSTDIQRR